MRMQDELVEIDATALRFDIAESENFLVDLVGWIWTVATSKSSPPRPTAGRGVAAGIAVAAGRRGPARLISTLTGHHYAISAFLAENVLYPGTVDAGLPAGHLDHRADLR